MTPQRAIFSFALCLVALALGCDQGPSNETPRASASTAPAASSPSAATPVEGRGGGVGSIHGTVSFQGAPPTMATIPNASCAETHVAIQDESIIVSKNSTLKNAVVYLENAPASSPAPTKPLVLDQVNCRYTPHVLALQTNQPLAIRSSDATFHNVHYSPDINPPSNFGMTAAGQETTVTFKSPEIIKFSCDVHPWMIAYVAVFDHPYFAISADNGTYEIKNVPAGSYTLACWHERLGKQQQNVTVGDNAVAQRQSDFTYKAP